MGCRRFVRCGGSKVSGFVVSQDRFRNGCGIALSACHRRGISYDEQRNTYTVTTRAYDKLKEQYRIRYETCLD